MRIVDPGHRYALTVYDSEIPMLCDIVFMKREGEGYPGNVGHHPGTNCQEVIRALIDRVKYLQGQIPCEENVEIIDHLRSALRLFEERANRRHGRVRSLDIESLPTCVICGHIECDHPT